MKTVKFKNLYIQNRRKIIFALAASVILTSTISSNIATSISDSTIDYALKKVQKENTVILRQAFLREQDDGIDVEELIKVIKNSEEEIVEVDFDLKSCSKILAGVTDYLNDYFESYNFYGYRLDVPLGFLSESPLLVNMGPKIPIKVELSDVALGNVKTEIREFGLNSALVEVYLEINIRTNILYPLKETNRDYKFESLVASKIIAGSIPEFYNGTINSKSSDVSLPLDE